MVIVETKYNHLGAVFYRPLVENRGSCSRIETGCEEQVFKISGRKSTRQIKRKEGDESRRGCSV